MCKYVDVCFGSPWIKAAVTGSDGRREEEREVEREVGRRRDGGREEETRREEEEEEGGRGVDRRWYWRGRRLAR